MVLDRIKFIRIFIVLCLTVLFLMLLLTKNSSTETNFAKAILPEEVVNNTKIIPLIEHSASTIKVVFESNSDVQELKDKFLQNLNPEDFSVVSPDFSGLLDWYGKAPSNFVSVKTRELLKAKNYDTVYQQGLERLYSPTGFSVVSLDKDPFMLLTDFLYSNDTFKQNKNINGKYYDTTILQIKSNNIKDLIKLKNKSSDRNNHIYLAGTPIHTYYTILASTVSINIICVLITFLIIFLTYFYFKHFKLLIPIALNIAFGFLAGFSVTKFVYPNLHLITFLFGTTLIGIGVDYSYHYIFKENFDSRFVKDLTLSVLSTVAAFSLLYLAKTDILNQISTFTISGLIAIYLFIMILYPIIKFPSPNRIINPEINNKFKKILIIFISAVIIFGLPKIKFNDDLTALYTPNKSLLKAEALFSKISNQEAGKNYIYAVKGNSIQDILEKEEGITKQLDNENINYICISKFIPSEKKQKENTDLVKILYNNELNKYNDILSKQQIDNLKHTENKALTININDYPFFKNLLLDKKTSMIVAFSEKLPAVDSDDVEIISIQNILSNHLSQHRHSLQKLLPIIYLLLYLILSVFYGLKNSFRMFMPIMISQVFVVAFMSLIGIKLNMFSVLGLILSIGFTIDYTIFSKNKSKQTAAAIFLACITTAFSFFFLIFTTFKLISMLALTTSLCILSSFLLTKIFIQEK